jgi:hypothetical protein
MIEEFYEGKAIIITQQQYKNFLAKIDKKESGCWEWLGFIDKDGYGSLVLTLNGKQKYMRAHRLSYLLFIGKIKEVLVTDHLCRNRSCVNPHHLEIITSSENVFRGTGITAVNLKKTECKNGHKFSEENTYIYQRKDGRIRRDCRQCRKISSQKSLEKRERLA